MGIMKNKAIALNNLIGDWKTVNMLIKDLEKERKEYRQAILDTMTEIGQKNFECSSGVIKVTYPRTFDQTMMLNNQPKEIMDRFWEKKIVEANIFNVKSFKKSHPELWEKYQIDLTPRVSIK